MAPNAARIAVVDTRRIGGLENVPRDWLGDYQDTRRIGGLETCRPREPISRTDTRRIGGLENSATHTNRSSGRYPPYRRFREVWQWPGFRRC